MIGEPQSSSLARRAVRLYRRSADRALLRSEFLAGAALLRPIPDLCSPDDPMAVLALCDRCWHLRMGFHLEEAAEVAGAAVVSARLSGDVGLVALGGFLMGLRLSNVFGRVYAGVPATETLRHRDS